MIKQMMLAVTNRKDLRNDNNRRIYPAKTRMRGHLVTALLALSSVTRVLAADPVVIKPETINLTTPVRAVTPAPLDGGTATNPQGHTITCDSLSFYIDGKPWIPVAGEFHFSRYPETEWREELYKMKAGGLDVVSTYIFWIHHEEEQGNFDWSGCRDVRKFLKICQEVGLKAIVRLGPWCHGEVRNGGTPDWVFRAAKTKEEGKKYIDILYQEEAKQMEGLYWKDGGPIIAVQLDNESSDGEYLLYLKKLAQSKGIDVPFYTITGWQGGVPERGLLPLFGAYVNPFWGFGLENDLKEFFFTSSRCNNNLGSGMEIIRSAELEKLSVFPFACAEIGGGMQCSFKHRVKVVPLDIAAISFVRLGCGNNMPGYYMYHGGVNPEGKKLKTLNEEGYNHMPVKDYDFQTALGACGQAREQFYLLRQQHLFLQDFGDSLAQMPSRFPDKKPSRAIDQSLVRWAVRSNKSSGFLFFSNYQPYGPLAERKNLQFQLKTAEGEKLIPSRPFTLPPGSFGVLPFGMDCSGVKVDYATVQPLCRMENGKNVTYFFAELPEVTPEFMLNSSGQITASVKVEQTPTGSLISGIKPSTNAAVRIKTAEGNEVDFVVLNAHQATRLGRFDFGGKKHLVISDALVFENGTGISLQADRKLQQRMLFFPKLSALTLGGEKINATEDGVFAAFNPTATKEAQIFPVTIQKQVVSKLSNMKLYGSSTRTPWNNSVEYSLDIPADAAKGRSLLNINYIGEAARLYLGDQLVIDNFFNGDPMPVALWRIPQGDWPRLTLKVLPYSSAMNARLRDYGRQVVDEAKAKGLLNMENGTMETIPATVKVPIELTVLP